MVSRETLLSYSNFNNPFEIYTDSSKLQLGSVIGEEGKPIVFYTRKFKPAQVIHTTTEHELPSIVETLKEFRYILLGQQIKVCTDHKNLFYKAFNTESVMKWRCILEENNPELIYIYIQGYKNIATDALSRFNKVDTNNAIKPNVLS